MSLFEYDEKEHMLLEREEGISDTKAIGTISEQYEMDSAEIRTVISANQQVHYESAFFVFYLTNISLTQLVEFATIEVRQLIC